MLPPEEMKDISDFNYKYLFIDFPQINLSIRMGNMVIAEEERISNIPIITLQASRLTLSSRSGSIGSISQSFVTSYLGVGASPKFSVIIFRLCSLIIPQSHFCIRFIKEKQEMKWKRIQHTQHSHFIPHKSKIHSFLAISLLWAIKETPCRKKTYWISLIWKDPLLPKDQALPLLCQQKKKSKISNEQGFVFSF